MQNDLDFDYYDSEEIKANQREPQKNIIKLDSKFFQKKIARKSTPALLIYKKLDIYDSDYDRLEPGSLLNDKVIDFFVEFLIELKNYSNLQKNIKNNTRNILCSYVFSSLDMYQYNSIVFDLKGPQKYFRIDNQKSILQVFDRVYLVVNEANFHWILIEIFLEESNFKKNQEFQSEKISNLTNQQQICVSSASSLKNSTQSSIKRKSQSKNQKKQRNVKQGILEQNEYQFQTSLLPNTQKEFQQDNTQIKQNSLQKQLLQEQSTTGDIESVVKQNEIIQAQVIKTITMKVYNSLGQRSSIENQTAIVLLKKYFLNDFKELHGQECLVEFNIISEKVPTQTGGSDCGVFCCKYLQKLFYEESQAFDYSCFTQTRMIEYREFIQQLMIEIKNSNNEYSKVYEKYINLKL